MSDGYVGFCTKCGTRFDGPEVFCTKCGAPREHAAPAESPAAPGPTLVQQAGQAASTASRAYGTVARVAGVAGMGVALPWQTVVGGQQPDIRAFLSAAALPAAQGAIRASLKRPGIAMAVTTTLDLVVSGITRGWGGVLGALPRFLLGGATALFSLITGSKGGPLRKLTGAVGGVTAVVQLGFTGYTLVTGVLGGTSALLLDPAGHRDDLVARDGREDRRHGAEGRCPMRTTRAPARRIAAILGARAARLRRRCAASPSRSPP